MRSACALATLSLAMGAFALLSANPASAQKQRVKTDRLPASLVIYRGEDVKISGVVIAGYGSGTIEESSTQVYGGASSLKIATHGAYQGGSITFAKPADVGSYVANKFAYLQFDILLQDALAPTTAAPSSSSSGSSQNSYAQFTSGRGKGGFGGGGAAAGGTGGAAATRLNYDRERKISSFRTVLTTSSGKKHEFLLDMKYAVDDNNWKQLNIPISKIPGLEATDGQITAIQLFGDAPGTFFLGNISVTEDSTPITLDEIGEKSAVAKLDVYTYRASARGGATPLLYSWDWDASDGIQEEAEGRAVLHAFRKASTVGTVNKPYIVTLTVRDLYGIKAPVSTTFKVYVTP